MAAAVAPAALVPLAEGAEQPAFKKVKLKLAPKPRKKRGPMPAAHEPKQCDECGEWLAGGRLLKKHKKKPSRWTSDHTTEDKTTRATRRRLSSRLGLEYTRV